MTSHLTRASGEYDVHIQMAWMGDNQLIVDKAKWKILQVHGAPHPLRFFANCHADTAAAPAS